MFGLELAKYMENSYGLLERLRVNKTIPVENDFQARNLSSLHIHRLYQIVDTTIYTRVEILRHQVCFKWHSKVKIVKRETKYTKRVVVSILIYKFTN